MNIPLLGTLLPAPDIPEWLNSDEVVIPYFDGEKLKFVLMNFAESDGSEVNEVVTAFLGLGSDARLAAAKYVFANYRRVAELISEEDLGCKIDSSAEVWSHVRPTKSTSSADIGGTKSFMSRLRLNAIGNPNMDFKLCIAADVSYRE